MKGQANLSDSEIRSPASSTDVPVLYYIPAPFPARFSAHVIDRLILYIFVLPVFGLLVPATETGTPRREFPTAEMYVILFLITPCVYLVLARRGQTIGKFLTRCKVVRYDGTTASASVVLVRETVGKLISSFLAIGFIWCIFDSERRTLHDIMSRTYVVDCSKRAQDYARAADKRMHAYRLRTGE